MLLQVFQCSHVMWASNPLSRLPSNTQHSYVCIIHLLCLIMLTCFCLSNTNPPTCQLHLRSIMYDTGLHQHQRSA